MNPKPSQLYKKSFVYRWVWRVDIKGFVLWKRSPNSRWVYKEPKHVWNEWINNAELI